MNNIKYWSLLNWLKIWIMKNNFSLIPYKCSDNLESKTIIVKILFSQKLTLTMSIMIRKIKRQTNLTQMAN